MVFSAIASALLEGDGPRVGPVVAADYRSKTRSECSILAAAAIFDLLISFVLSFRAYLRTQANNQLEILALRHPIVVLQRQNPKQN